jgi:hypothetical protein
MIGVQTEGNDAENGKCGVFFGFVEVFFLPSHRK